MCSHPINTIRLQCQSEKWTDMGTFSTECYRPCNIVADPKNFCHVMVPECNDNHYCPGLCIKYKLWPLLDLVWKFRIWLYKLSNKKTHLPYSIVHMYVINDYLTACSSRWKNIFEQSIKKICSPLNNAASQLVNYSIHTGSLNSMAKAMFWHFWSKINAKPEFSRIFKDSVWLEKWTNLDTKGVKWSVN